MNDVRTSIVIPAFNREWCIHDAMASALLASSAADEIIAVDDGSTDATLRLMNDVARGAPGRVRVLRHPGGRNRGISATRNLGVHAARGRYIAFLDSDDLYEPARLADAPDWLDRHPDMLAAIEPYQTVQLDGRGPTTVEFHLTRRETTPPSEMLRLMLFESVYWNTPSITVRREAFDRVGLFDPSFSFGEDTALWLRLAATGRVGVAQADKPKITVRRGHTQHSWRPAQPVVGHRTHLRGLITALRWTKRRHVDVPGDSVALLRQRLRTFVREICADTSLPSWFRVEAWARAVSIDPAMLLNRSVNANLARMILPQSIRQ